MIARIRRTARAVADRPDALPLLAAGLLLFVGVQVALMSRVPSWANDEPAHVGYVASLAEGRLPTIDTDIVDDPSRFPLTAEEFSGRDEAHGDIWTANHPPLFHLAMVPVWWALHDVNQSGMVITMRIANTIGFAVWLYLVGILARHLVPARPAVAALAVVVATAPTLVLRSSYLQNDGWAAASAVLLLLMTVRMLREEVTPQRVAIAVAAGTIAAGTRAQGVLVVALCSTVLLVALARRHRGPWAGWRPGLTVFALVGGVPAAAWGWFYVRNRRLYGDVTGQDALLEKFERSPVPVDRLFTIRTLEQPVVATSLALVAALVLIPLALRASVRRHGVRWDPVWCLLLVHASLTLGSLVGFMRAGGGFHDRYLMQAMPLLATATAVGMVGVGRWWRSASPGTVAAGRRDWWVAVWWSVVLLGWLAATLVWLEDRHIFSRQELSPVEGPVPPVLVVVVIVLGAAIVAVMVRRARAFDPGPHRVGAVSVGRLEGADTADLRALEGQLVPRR
ncbi:DUF2142 domain-containing protein [Nocardioides hwasunensis]|uniref:DUF2142 domain-containing protein n=1 Tax=Nocardioides hwasunensis TaxID=397258 RepID=A0ABR8MG92_9ACTN|nr:DUF2142 domain-containing protein [Nocardioides hwasunensis]MBD3913129.1 DUF2142 domain-containing protein [Nocardioides hwasunensis]